MEASVNANVTELPSSPPAAEQPTFNDNRQATAVHNAQGQTNDVKIKTEPPVSIDSNMNGQQPRVVYHMEAGRDSEAEDVHVSHHPDNTVDFSAGVQCSEVNWISSESESEGESEAEMQELGDGDKPPMQCSGNVGSNAQRNSDKAASNGETPGSPHQLTMPGRSHLDYNDIHDEERGIFVDFDGDPDVDDDEARSIHETDNQIEEDIGSGFGSIKAFVYPQTTEIISTHLSIPVPQSFTSLNDLLSTHNAPGRGLYKVEKVLEHEEARAAELEEKLRYIEAELQEVRARRDRAGQIVREASTAFSKARVASGIRNDLWKEYEAFCESLGPKFGDRGGWSVTCFEDHSGSYVRWDPELELLLQSADVPLGSCNFRCEATTVSSMGRTEYVVEFWPLASPEPLTETATTWKQQYPDLYRLANKAANNSNGDNTIAKALLRSLPSPNLPFSGGWLFEYALEPGRAQHPTVSRRWSYRSACRIPIDRQPDQDHVMAESESEESAAGDDAVDYDGSESAESQDVKMEDDEIESIKDVKMEDDG